MINLFVSFISLVSSILLPIFLSKKNNKGTTIDLIRTLKIEIEENLTSKQEINMAIFSSRVDELQKRLQKINEYKKYKDVIDTITHALEQPHLEQYVMYKNNGDQEEVKCLKDNILKKLRDLHSL